eukprot:1143263-Pelagomonas_calceolata.AAC.2
MDSSREYEMRNSHLRHAHYPVLLTQSRRHHCQETRELPEDMQSSRGTKLTSKLHACCSLDGKTYFYKCGITDKNNTQGPASHPPSSAIALF